MNTPMNEGKHMTSMTPDLRATAPSPVPTTEERRLLERETEEIRALRSTDPSEETVHEVHSRQYLRLRPVITERLAALDGRDVELALDGFSILLDPADPGAAHTLACHWSGQLEPLELALFEETARSNPGCLVLDVGANYGLYTLVSCRLARIGLVGPVISLEPDPEVSRTLERSLTANGFEGLATVLRAAAHERDETLRFHINAGGSVDNRTSLSGDIPVRETIEVDGRGLDSLATGHPDAPGVIVKMDIQGHEPVALRGMRGLLDGDRPLALFMEVTPRMMPRDDYTPEEFAADLFGHGFDLVLDLNEETGEARPLDTPADLVRLLGELENATGYQRSYTNIGCFRGLESPRTRKLTT